MPDHEHDLPSYSDDEEDRYNDEDVPFKLPKVTSDEDTDEIEIPPEVRKTAEQSAAQSTEQNPSQSTASAPARGSNNMPTMPIFREPGVPDYKQTLPGSGGLDPNPDFQSGMTTRHPRVQTPPPAPPPPPSQPAYQAYQRPPTYAQTQPNMPPVPPAQKGNGGVPAQRPLPRRRRRRTFLGMPMGCLWVFLGILVTFCGGLTLISTVLFGIAYSRVDDLVKTRITDFDKYSNFQSTFIYDRSGNQLYEAFKEGRRTNVKYNEFPKYLIDATVSIEDDSFFTNPGIDVSGTTRALLQYVGLKSGSSGGSTITQQLVRNVLFDPQYRSERSIQRKIEEIVLALALTQKKSKQDILELYLNEIYYGNMAYGAEAASETFFGKHVSQITLCEAALLAGLPQAPAELDPLNPDPAVQDAVQTRLNLVLDAMVKTKAITPQERAAACQGGLSFVPPQVSLLAPHFTVYAQAELESLLRNLGYTPEQITNGGLKVYTTIDLHVNDLAQQAIRQQVAKLAPNRVTNGAVVVIVPQTGEIIAMVGSVDYNNDAIDGRVNVTTSLRQPGSTMKVFTYSSAMEQGMTPGDVIWDTPTQIGLPGQQPYVPTDYDGAFHGPVRMRTALANSYNIPAVQTLRRVGVDYLLNMMRRVGVSTLNADPSQYGLSLTLGGGEVSPIELTQGYAVFANQGVLVPVTSIRCILDSKDNIIYQYNNGCPQGNPTSNTVNRGATDQAKQVLDPRIAYIISDILHDNNARTPAMGPNSVLRTDGIYTSVKTGTTNDFKDNWTEGFTRNVAIGVWVGNNNGDPMNHVSGLDGAAPIWNVVMRGIYGDQSLLSAFAVNGQLMPDQINPPQGMSLRKICDVRTLADPAVDCTPNQAEWFLDGPPGIPDDQGNLIFQQVAQPNAQQPPASGPFLQQYQPGIYKVLVKPIPPDVAAGITFPNTNGKQPPPPRYCQVPVELAASAAGAQEQLFIAPPPVPDDAIAAENYAISKGLAFLPTIACTPQLLTAQGGFGPAVVTAVITSPTPGQAVPPQGLPIIGTVQFTPDQAQFYKLEIKGGQFPDWVTIGTTHNGSVINGQLEMLPGAPGLQPGNYQLRLVLVSWGGGFLQDPYIVPFVVQ